MITRKKKKAGESVAKKGQSEVLIESSRKHFVVKDLSAREKLLQKKKGASNKSYFKSILRERLLLLGEAKDP